MKNITRNNFSLIFIGFCFLGGCARAVNPTFEHPSQSSIDFGSIEDSSSSEDAALMHFSQGCYCLDRDGDGLGDPRMTVSYPPIPRGYVHNCTDANDQITDGCNTIQSNPQCRFFCRDADGDGVGSWSSLKLAIHQTSGFVPMVNDYCNDCDDTDPAIGDCDHP